MLRLSLAVLLVCVSANAMAQHGPAALANPGACQETETVVRDSGDQITTVRSKAATTRSKYARPATSSTVTGGGSDDAMPRSRGARWHSFLPGMFR